jgi:hypothetical protein
MVAEEGLTVTTVAGRTKKTNVKTRTLRPEGCGTLHRTDGSSLRHPPNTSTELRLQFRAVHQQGQNRQISSVEGADAHHLISPSPPGVRLLMRRCKRIKLAALLLPPFLPEAYIV